MLKDAFKLKERVQAYDKIFFEIARKGSSSEACANESITLGISDFFDASFQEIPIGEVTMTNIMLTEETAVEMTEHEIEFEESREVSNDELLKFQELLEASSYETLVRTLPEQPNASSISDDRPVTLIPAPVVPALPIEKLKHPDDLIATAEKLERQALSIMNQFPDPSSASLPSSSQPEVFVAPIAKKGSKRPRHQDDTLLSIKEEPTMNDCPLDPGSTSVIYEGEESSQQLTFDMAFIAPSNDEQTQTRKNRYNRSTRLNECLGCNNGFVTLEQLYQHRQLVHKGWFRHIFFYFIFFSLKIRFIADCFEFQCKFCGKVVRRDEELSHNRVYHPKKYPRQRPRRNQPRNKFRR